MFRFLKKQDGTKILQYRDMGTLEFKDVPMVEEEESAINLLRNSLFKIKVLPDNFVILLNQEFAEKLKQENSTEYTFAEINSFYGHRVYVTNMIPKFKFMQEI